MEDKKSKRKVSFLLGIGIALVPFVFVWALFGKGYNPLARGLSFSWLIISLVLAIVTDESNHIQKGERSAMARTIYELVTARNIDTTMGIKRTQYTIRIDNDLNEQQIREILQQAVKDLSRKRKVDALAVRLCIGDSDFPRGVADWAPYGEWSMAEKGMSKSVFKTSIQIFEPINYGGIEDER